MSTHVPDIARGGSLRGYTGPGQIAGTDTPPRFAPQFTAVPPPQTMGDVRGNDGRKRKALGLIPAVAGATFPLVIRDRPKERVSPREIGLMRVELRKADAQATTLETALIAVTAERGAQHPDAIAKLSDARAAVDRAAIFRRRLAAAEQSAVGRPTAVHTAIVREPAEVPDALADADSPPVVVCLHDGCKGQRWATEADMRMAHPTNAEMQRTQQAHVYVYLSETPADPLDPDGEKVGYIAPIGRDGTTVRQAAAMSEDEGGDARLAELEARNAVQARLAALEARNAELLAVVEALSKSAKKT